MRAFLVLIAIQIAIALWIAFLPSEPREPHAEACYRLERATYDAAQCNAFPQMWEEWDRLNAAYGNKTDRKGAIGCPVLMKEVQSFGIFDGNDGRAIFQIIKTAYQDANEKDIEGKIYEATGDSFCKVADRNGWIQSYMRMNPLKTDR